MGYFDFPHTRNYDQDLGYLIEQYKHLTDLYEDLKEQSTEYVDEQIRLVLEQLVQDIVRVTEVLKEYSDEQNNILKEDLVQKINQVNNRITQINFELTNKINSDVASANQHTDSQIADLKTYVDNQFIDLRVLNPVTGNASTIQQALDSLFELHRDNALTANEYDALTLTATAYDAYQITAFEYDTNGKILLI